MKENTIRLQNGETVKVPKGTTLLELAKGRGGRGDILAAIVDNQIMELDDAVYEDCTVEFLTISHPDGFRVYQRSAAFLLTYAVKEALGPQTAIVIKHSVNKNLYCELSDANGPIPAEKVLGAIEAAMNEAVAKDAPVEKRFYPKDEALSIIEGFSNDSLLKNLKYHRERHVRLYKLGAYYDCFYGYVVPRAGLITRFRLVPDGAGFFLQLPSPDNPETFLEVKDLRKIRRVYEESNMWSSVLNVDTVGALNEAVCGSRGGDIIRVSEALHEKRFSAIADDIYNQQKSIVLVAGPSSSGKTTFANRLCVQLNVLGLRPHIISLDDYFNNRDTVPKDEFGNPDFESFDFLDKEQLNKDLSGLLSGRRVEIPTYNFKTGEREYRGNYLELSDNDVLVVEGIHGLNGALTDGVKDADKYKIFISAFTQIHIDHHNRIPTSDVRLLRRVVRDMRTRGYSASRTLSMWGSVARGEARNIFPFQEEADAVFNSALVYELSILKQYVEPLLFDIPRDKESHADARRLLTFLDCFVALPPDEVPNNSILREFIGGSCFLV